VPAASPHAAATRRWAGVAVAWSLAGLAALQAQAPDADSAFRTGLVALHNFEYEEAQAAFAAAQRADPGLALAHWGEALTYHQTLWGQEDVAAGRRALAHARAALAGKPAPAPLVAAQLDAAAMLFGGGDAVMRRQRYADAMAAAHAIDRDDPDVAALYALALLGTASRGLAGGGGATHDLHVPSLAGSPVQAQAGAILGRVLQSHPRHPGALHYLLHAYDDPEHAALALDAARAYATVAPQSTHALHMPAHIFLQLGHWADAEASDRAAFAASQAWVAKRGLPAAMHNFHALAWRQYELLQLGRPREAAALVGELEPVVKTTGDLRLLSDLASMRARQVVETGDWPRLARERNFANVNELCAIGFAAARSGNLELAELARAGLAGRAAAPEEGALRPAIAIMERQVAALIALAGGRTAEAIAILQAATTSELALPAPFGLPIPILPAPELLGDVLLEQQRPAEALDAYSQALARNANRTRAVLGSARAAARLGRTDLARQHFEAVLANYAGADADRPELAEARAALESPAGTSTPGAPARLPWMPIVVVAAGIVVVLLGVIARRTATRPAVPSTPPPSADSQRRRKPKRK
jgi:tetratricopeptide (TPR) repeat protein